jgi:hypothetical protein
MEYPFPPRGRAAERAPYVGVLLASMVISSKRRLNAMSSLAKSYGQLKIGIRCRNTVTGA